MEQREEKAVAAWGMMRKMSEEDEAVEDTKMVVVVWMMKWS